MTKQELQSLTIEQLNSMTSEEVESIAQEVLDNLTTSEIEELSDEVRKKLGIKIKSIWKSAELWIGLIVSALIMSIMQGIFGK
ncbi:hypothetical protein I6E11_14225 [Bacteroides caecigallinarum]|uniref:hypothetical protein n=1 Tax=Bacteroides caecigallinarum TaxID=1411144 RepID=UPI001F481FCE|nr:hypothetical protein [Bacteroides caecigallinarum]MCF2594919.1 hypothetical protein [Bacteroides caecigallinarum]